MYTYTPRRWTRTPCAAPRRISPAGMISRSVRIERVGEELRITYTGDGFLYNMARILTGTLLEIGSGERPADDIGRIFQSRSRAEAGFTAPAKGLCLMSVRY